MLTCSHSLINNRLGASLNRSVSGSRKVWMNDFYHLMPIHVDSSATLAFQLSTNEYAFGYMLPCAGSIRWKVSH